MSSKVRRARTTQACAVVLAVLAAQLALPSLTRATTPEVYSIAGYEIWFGRTVGRFVGGGYWAGGELSAWYGSIEHSESVSPTGIITGGRATLYRMDGVWITGNFGGGVVQQTNEGAGCTDESHTVNGILYGVTRSDRDGPTGAAVFDATLIHHHAWIFGRCITYSASVVGTISVIF